MPRLRDYLRQSWGREAETILCRLEIPSPIWMRVRRGGHRFAPAKSYSFTEPGKNTRQQILKARSHPWNSLKVPIKGFECPGRADRE
jgi:hypothetical protein